MLKWSADWERLLQQGKEDGDDGGRWAVIFNKME